MPIGLERGAFKNLSKVTGNRKIPIETKKMMLKSIKETSFMRVNAEQYPKQMKRNEQATETWL